MAKTRPRPRRPQLIDIEAVGRDYRTGAFTDRELADKYKRSHTWVQKLAAKMGWQKDLQQAVEIATQAKLAEIEVSKTQNSRVAAKIRKQIQAALPATQEVVAALAEINTQVVMRHRHELRIARTEVMSLWEELRVAAEEGAALAGRIAASGVLVTALSRLHERESVAYGLTDNDRNPRDGRLSLPIRFVDVDPRKASDG